VARAVTILVMLVALAVGTFALARLDTWGESDSTAPQRFQLDLQEQVQIPPELIAYREQSRFGTTLRSPLLWL